MTPLISTRIERIQFSPIRKLAGLADAARKEGVEVIPLNIGQPDIKTPPAFFEAIKNNSDQILAYSPSAGNALLLQQLVDQYYAPIGIAIEPKHLLITTGGSEAIYFSLATCFDIDDEILIPEPFYTNYQSFAQTLGLRTVAIPSLIENGFALPPIALFENKITTRTKGILLCNPNNPTGYVYGEQELLDLLKLCKKHNLFLICDEAYREFVYEDSCKSVMMWEEYQEHVIMIDTFSKRYSVCGARLGMMVSRNEEVMKHALKLAQARLSPPGLAMIGASALLNLKGDYFKTSKQEYLNRRNVLVAGLNAIKGVHCPLPKGAFYAIASLPVEDAEHFCSWMLREFRWENSTIMLTPAQGFYQTPLIGRAQVRLAYVIEESKIVRALACLAKGLECYPQH